MKRSLIAAAALAGILASGPAIAQDEGVELGLLDCLIEGDIGAIIGSSRDMTCTFTSADDAQPEEVYVGVVNRFGLDLGATGDQVMQWLVLAPTADYFAPGILEGDYVGASAEATVGAGVGANVLIGGSENTISLQPVSVQAQTGLNLALGVTEFQLRAAP